MSQPFHLYLIRHAQSANNAKPEAERVEDPGLTELGERQADLLAERFRGLHVSHLLTSGFRRAVQTMRPLAAQLNQRPVIWSELHEVGGCFAGYQAGDLQGRPGMNRSALSGEFPEFELPDDIDERGWWKSRPFEQTSAARERARQQSTRLLQEFGGTAASVACVIHADFKALLLETLLSDIDRAHVAAADLLNTGVTLLSCAAEKISVLDLNDASHLPKDLMSS